MTNFSTTAGRLTGRNRLGGRVQVSSMESLGLTGLRRGVAQGLAAWAVWRERARTRRQLMSLGDDALKDIGLGRGDAFGEYIKPFWRP